MPATRSNPTKTEERLARLEAAVVYLAREQMNQSGARPGILEILEAFLPEMETRPDEAPEQRQVTA